MLKLKQVLDFFSPNEAPSPELSVDESAAVLLIEVMLADHDADQREQECITNILSQRMQVSVDEAKACVDVAVKRHQQSHDLYQFTRIINEQYGEQERFQLVVDLWRVAFADTELDKYEDHRIRQVNELLHLHHSHFIRAKAQAQAIK